MLRFARSAKAASARVDASMLSLFEMSKYRKLSSVPVFFLVDFFPLPLSSGESVAVSKYFFERSGAFTSFSTEIVNKFSKIVADLCVRKTSTAAEDVSRSFTRAEIAHAATDASVLKSLPASSPLPLPKDGSGGSLLLLCVFFLMFLILSSSC